MQFMLLAICFIGFIDSSQVSSDATRRNLTPKLKVNLGANDAMKQ